VKDDSASRSATSGGGPTDLPVVARRAPDVVRKIAVGAFGAGVLGILIGLALPGSGVPLKSLVALLCGMGFAIIGGLVAGAVSTVEHHRYDPTSEWRERVDRTMREDGSQ
jgi:hypothetical protein